MVTESRSGVPAPLPPPTSSGPTRLFTDPLLLALPERTRLTGLGLWHQHVDQSGMGPADPKMVRESVWAARPDVTDDDVLDDVVALGDAGWLSLVDGPRGLTLLQLEGWHSTAPTPPTARNGHLAPGVVGGEEGRVEDRKEQAPPPPPSGPVPLSATLDLLADMPEPSPFCSRHQPWGSDEKCGPCGGARKRHELWSKANKTRETR
ncbi:hypothetical protein [Isoptericola sp. QY 916]|uniref:hypothetical protein n=1 Tax=Isoptericola sp. QY 916 TaxID=2782570 RepID=UPI003D2FDC09|nr:hypothetical protein [Isoptericola sp. QY 916]